MQILDLKLVPLYVFMYFKYILSQYCAFANEQSASNLS